MGRKKIPIHHVFALVKELNCNPDEIVGEWHGAELDSTDQTKAG